MSHVTEGLPRQMSHVSNIKFHITHPNACATQVMGPQWTRMSHVSHPNHCADASHGTIMDMNESRHTCKSVRDASHGTPTVTVLVYRMALLVTVLVYRMALFTVRV